MGWVLERASGRRYADLVSELLWKPMGAGNSAYITVDRLGAPRCAGGFCATARDLVRLGLLIAEGGSYAGKEIIPSWWIDDILNAGDTHAWDVAISPNISRVCPCTTAANGTCCAATLR
jgi:CubicO group peptidase (beta-lactamase class C family)